MSKNRNAFALAHSRGGFILPSIRHNEDQVRAYAVEIERMYDDATRMTDKQLWKRCYGQGFRVVAVVVTRPHLSTPEK
jgi:hypothetical protein